jgi:hypothetical protein
MLFIGTPELYESYLKIPQMELPVKEKDRSPGFKPPWFHQTKLIDIQIIDNMYIDF